MTLLHLLLSDCCFITSCHYKFNSVPASEGVEDCMFFSAVYVIDYGRNSPHSPAGYSVHFACGCKSLLNGDGSVGMKSSAWCLQFGKICRNKDC